MERTSASTLLSETVVYSSEPTCVHQLITFAPLNVDSESCNLLRMTRRETNLTSSLQSCRKEKVFARSVLCNSHNPSISMIFSVTCFSVSSKILPDSVLSITCRVFRYVLLRTLYQYLDLHLYRVPHRFQSLPERFTSSSLESDYATFKSADFSLEIAKNRSKYFAA